MAPPAVPHGGRTPRTGHRMRPVPPPWEPAPTPAGAALPPATGVCGPPATASRPRSVVGRPQAMHRAARRPQSAAAVGWPRPAPAGRHRPAPAARHGAHPVLPPIPATAAGARRRCGPGAFWAGHCGPSPADPARPHGGRRTEKRESGGERPSPSPGWRPGTARSAWRLAAPRPRRPDAVPAHWAGRCGSGAARASRADRQTHGRARAARYPAGGARPPPGVPGAAAGRTGPARRRIPRPAHRAAPGSGG